MGLRMWTDDDTIVEDAAAKLDRAAAVRRSTIRRETSIRPHRDHVPPQSISVFLRSRHQNMLRTRDRLRQEERETDSQIAQLQAELERLRRMRLRNRVRLNEELETSRPGRDSAEQTSQTDQLTPDETGAPAAENPLDTTQPALPRPPRESSLRFEVLPSSTSRSTSPWRYQVLSRATMPSPPRSSDSDRRDLSIPDGPIPGDSWSIENPRMPALTEGFAPAQAGSHSVSEHHDINLIDVSLQGLETPPPESWEGSYPPLQRVGHISPHPPQQVDGLGDRRRSVSSFSEHNEEDTWMSNLLTTMDTSRSSSATSFSSTNSDSLRRSNNSSQTSTSFGEIGAVDDTCELDLPEGITEDDVRMIRERHYRNEHHRFTDSQVMMALRELRAHMDRVGNTDFSMFQAILDRMQRREPIPQEWWMSVGLPPDFGRRQLS